MKINKEKEAALPCVLLKELLRYESETGLFYRLVANSQCTKVGQLAGSVDDNGYVRISVNGHRYLAHRLAWVYVHGDYPSGEQPFIDHINGNRSDNRIENLKVCSGVENMKNQKKSTKNTSGVIGVYRQEIVRPSGKIYYYWVTHWCNENGKQRNKSFSITKLGEEQAKQLAIDYRDEQIRLLEVNHNIIYSERHGI